VTLRRRVGRYEADEQLPGVATTVTISRRIVDERDSP